MVVIIVIIGLIFLGLIYYQIQKRIGEEQAREWQEYKKANPQLFFTPPKPPASHGTRASVQEETFIHDMWTRYNNSHPTRSHEI